MFEPRELGVTADPCGSGPINRDGFQLVEGPPVIRVTLLAKRQGLFHDGDFGYRLVECSQIAPYAIYAWPLPLWAFLRARALVWDGFYRLLAWLYRRGFITMKGPENAPWRLRDLRPRIPLPLHGKGSTRHCP